jgi:hypothetical protein
VFILGHLGTRESATLPGRVFSQSLGLSVVFVVIRCDLSCQTKLACVMAPVMHADTPFSMAHGCLFWAERFALLPAHEFSPDIRAHTALK